MVRLLIVGTGAMAERHAQIFGAIPGVSVVAGVDLNERRLAAFCGQFAIPHAFTDLDEAIAWGGVDAVSNVTPDVAHHSTTLRLAKAMAPIFCEKPLAPTYALA